MMKAEFPRHARVFAAVCALCVSAVPPVAEAVEVRVISPDRDTRWFEESVPMKDGVKLYTFLHTKGDGITAGMMED